MKRKQELYQAALQEEQRLRKRFEALQTNATHVEWIEALQNCVLCSEDDVVIKIADCCLCESLSAGRTRLGDVDKQSCRGIQSVAGEARSAGGS